MEGMKGIMEGINDVRNTGFFTKMHEKSKNIKSFH